MPCSDPKLVRGVERPCGKCRYCLSLKRWRYSARIAAETHVAPRTWFVTLTLRKAMSDQIGYKIVQRWIKRVRAAGASLRYAAVAEHGSQATMRLHYHVVVHGAHSLTQRQLRSKWRGGISEATLVSSGDAPTVARYSSKMARYATKDGGGRFRFSQGYGSRAFTSICSSPLIQKVLECFPGSSVRVGGVNMPRRWVPDVAAERLLALTDEELEEVREVRHSHALHQMERKRWADRLARSRRIPKKGND